MDKKILYLVVPCYNEELALPHTAPKLLKKIKYLVENENISEKSRILLVDDGSKDKTWELIESLSKQDKYFSGLKLSRNKGHQNALLGGLMTAKKYADVIISLDADLQDDINAIDEMVENYNKGYEIVYGVRNSRKKDTFFKRFTAESFYKIMKFLGVDIVFNHADYRLMSKRALDEMGNFNEVNLFLRGIVPLLGFNSTTVEYERNERCAGESKYPLKKMLSFALDGITSFSIKPMRMILNLGVIIFIISLLVLAWSIIVKILGKTVSGWTTLVASIWSIGGIQLFCMGILGEYIGKIYLETKQRPKYIIEKIIGDNQS